MSDQDESNANLSNEDAHAEALINSNSNVFSNNELRKYTVWMGMSGGGGSKENSMNYGTNHSNVQSHLRQRSGFSSAIDADLINNSEKITFKRTESPGAR